MSTSTRPESTFTIWVTVCCDPVAASCSFMERPTSMRVPGARRSKAPPGSCLVVLSAAVVLASDACSVFENKVGSAANSTSAVTLLFMLEENGRKGQAFSLDQQKKC